MFNSFYGETLKENQGWVAGSFATLRSGDTSLRSTSRAPAVADRVRDYLLHLAVESPARKYQTLWPHQRNAVLRAIFTNELLRPHDAGWKDLLLNVVTGGGKTTIIAAIMAYLRVCPRDPLFPVVVAQYYRSGAVEDGWKMTEYRPEAVGEPAGKAGAVIGCLEASIQLIEVVEAEQSFAHSAQSAKIRTGMTKHLDIRILQEVLVMGILGGI